jgi:hypothetical protein
LRTEEEPAHVTIDLIQVAGPISLVLSGSACACLPEPVRPNPTLQWIGGFLLALGLALIGFYLEPMLRLR